MTGSLEGRVAVVTGANRGIGRAVAIELARAGAAVALGARDVSSVAPVGAEVESLGGDHLPAECDVANQRSMRSLADTVLKRFGRVDVVVANAGIAGPTKPMHEITLEEWRECVSTDLDGVYLTFRSFIPAMLERRSGSLIAVSSMTGKRPLAKMGVIGLCRSLALELGPDGIRVNSVCPGAVEGPRIIDVVRNQARAQGISEEAASRQFTDPAPLKRLVDPNEVGRACVFLASDAASAITGEDLNVTAGVVMY